MKREIYFFKLVGIANRMCLLAVIAVLLPFQNIQAQYIITPANSVISGGVTTAQANSNWCNTQNNMPPCSTPASSYNAESYNMGIQGGYTLWHTANQGITDNSTYGYGYDFDHNTGTTVAIGGSSGSTRAASNYGSQWGLSYSFDGTVRYFNINNLVTNAKQTYSSFGLITSGTGATLSPGAAISGGSSYSMTVNPNSTTVTNLRNGVIVVAGMSPISFYYGNTTGTDNNVQIPLKIIITFTAGNTATGSGTPLPLSLQGDLIFWKVSGPFTVNVAVYAWDGILASGNLGGNCTLSD